MEKILDCTHRAFESEENGIVLRYGAEDAHHGELHIWAKADGFIACGSAWFNHEEIRAFAGKLSGWPISQD